MKWILFEERRKPASYPSPGHYAASDEDEIRLTSSPCNNIEFILAWVIVFRKRETF